MVTLNWTKLKTNEKGQFLYKISRVEANNILLCPKAQRRDFFCLDQILPLEIRQTNLDEAEFYLTRYNFVCENELSSIELARTDQHS